MSSSINTPFRLSQTSSEQDKAREIIHDAAVDWARGEHIPGAKDMSDKALSVKLVLAGLGTTILLKQTDNGKFEFKEDHWWDKLLRWFSSKPDVIIEKNLPIWQRTQQKTHEAAFKELQAFKKIGEDATKEYTTANEKKEIEDQIVETRKQTTMQRAKQEETIKREAQATQKLANQLESKLKILEHKLTQYKSHIGALEIEKRDLTKELNLESFRLRKFQSEARQIVKKGNQIKEEAVLPGGALKSKKLEIDEQQKIVGAKNSRMNELSDEIARLKTDAIGIKISVERHAISIDKLDQALRSNDLFEIKATSEDIQKEFFDIDTSIPNFEYGEEEDDRYGEFLKSDAETSLNIAEEVEKLDIETPPLTEYEKERDAKRKLLGL